MADIYLAGYDMVGYELFEEYESLIWTERFQKYGDFVLTMKERPSIMTDLRNYKYLRMSETPRVMMIETIETKKQEDGENIVTLKGRSFEAFLATRSNKTITKEVIGLEMPAGEAARYFVERYCVNPATTAAHNLIPNLVTPAYPYPNDPKVNMIAERGDIYKIVQDICVEANLGFRIDKESDGRLVFRVYKGSDRTVIKDAYLEYSPDAETLENTTSVESISSYFNNARVIGFKDIVDVFTPGTPANPMGLERRTVVVEARDIGDENDTSTYDEQILALKYRGYQALASTENRYTKLVDGDVPMLSWNDGFFGLGDIVWVKDYYGTKAKMMISEQIWSMDATGERHIPTFQEI